MLDTLIQGLLLGGLYALFALGLSLMFGVMRLTNTAQGDFIVLAGFAVIAAVPWIAQSTLGATLVILPSRCAGYALQRWVLNGTLGRDPLPSLVVCRAVDRDQNALLEVFGRSAVARLGWLQHAQPGAWPGVAMVRCRSRSSCCAGGHGVAASAVRSRRSAGVPRVVGRP
jgi:branched-subunit amino acid ABC-type transport system permease component